MNSFSQEIQFIENKGQWPDYVVYKTPLEFGDIYFEKNQWSFLLTEAFHGHQDDEHIGNEIEAEHNLKGHFFQIIFQGSTTKKIETIGAAHELYYNYLLGKDKSKWTSHVPVYSEIKYTELYPGIDMLVKEIEGNLKYDFIISPGVSANEIVMQYKGVENPRIENGNFMYETQLASITELKPYAYQLINGSKTEVKCSFDFDEKANTLRFKILGKYDESKELIIDPSLVFSRLSGSTNWNFGFTATYDEIGRAYGGGIVFNTGGVYPTSVGAFDTSYNGGAIDIAISCYHQTTGAQIFGTYVGGMETDLPNSMIVNSAGELVVLGTTSSIDFPVSTFAFDTTFNGGDTADFPNNGVHLYSGSDIAVFKLSNDGSTLLASTYLGGTGNDGLNDDTIYQAYYDSTDLHFNYGDAFRGEVIIDSFDNIYIASSTNSNDFPLMGYSDTLKGMQDAVIVKLKPQLDSLVFSRYLGGSNNDGAYSMKIDDLGNLFVVGGTMSPDFPIVDTALTNYHGGVSDGFLAKLNGTNGQLQNDLFLGTSSYDQTYLIDVDLNNMVYVMGQSLGNYPIQNANYGNPLAHHFIHKFSNDLNASIFSTCFGNDSYRIEISPTAFMVDTCERVFVSGWGGYTNYYRNNLNTTYLLSGLPITANAIQSTYNNFGDFYFFILGKNANSLEYATFFGGTAREHVDGGTSRFDDKGIIYQAVCAACSGGTFLTSPGYANSATTQCNLGVIKFDLELPDTDVELSAFPTLTGCVPLTVNFSGTYSNVSSFQWDFDDGSYSNLSNPIHTYLDTGIYNISLIGIDSNSCNLADTAFVSVTVRDDSLSANFLDNIDIDCRNLTFSAKAPNYSTTQFDWDMGDGTHYFTDSVFHTYATAGDYNVSLHLVDSTSCELQDSTTAIIHIPPLFEAQIIASDTFGCIPLEVDFESVHTTFNSLQWNFGNGQTALNNIDTSITYTLVGNYNVQLIIVDSTTCNVSDTANVAIQTIADSTHAMFALDSVYFDCDSMQLNGTSLNPSATSYAWNFGNGTTSNQANASTIYNAGDYFGSYIVTDNSNVCYPTDTAVFEMHLLPRFEAQIIASDTFGCIPLEVDFESVHTTFNSLQWNFGNGQTELNNIDTSITYTQVGNYNVQLIIVDSTTCNVSDTATISIQTIADSTHALFALDSVYFDCDSMQLNGTSLNPSATSYAWNFGNGTSSNQANASTIYNAGDYFGSYIVTDISNVCYPTDTAVFEMHLLPKLEGIIVVDTFGCAPYTTPFEAASNRTNAIYYWTFGDGNSTYQEDTIYTYLLPGVYPVKLTITDSTSCNIDTLIQTTFVVEVGQVYIDNQVDTIPFQCDSLQMHLQSFYPGGIHTWDMGNGDVLIGTDLYYAYTQYGNYTITYTIYDSTQGCKQWDTAFYQVAYYRIDANLNASDTFGCIPLSVDFTNLTQGTNNYWWSNGNGQTGIDSLIPNQIYTQVGTYTFTLVATDVNSCNINDTVSITISTNDDAVVANFTADVLNQCDSNLLITIDNTSQNAVSYSWDFQLGTSAQMEIDTLQYNLPGTYTVSLIAVNENLCHPYDTTEQTFTMLPNVHAAFNVLAACEGTPILIDNLSAPNLYYTWNFGAGANSNEYEPEFVYQNGGEYTIQLIVADSNSCNQTDISYQSITVANYPHALFTTDTNYYIYPDEVEFNNFSTQYDGFFWRFGDGQTDSINYNAVHLYEQIDDFTPCLIAWNGMCLDTFCKDLKIDFIPLIGVPNAFSPNGDGVNDILFVKGLGIVEIKFTVYNRWGEIVFESTDQNIGWDGIFRGVLQEMEVYTYVVNAVLLDGSTPVLKGNVTLLH